MDDFQRGMVILLGVSGGWTAILWLLAWFLDRKQQEERPNVDSCDPGLCDGPCF